MEKRKKILEKISLLEKEEEREERNGNLNHHKQLLLSRLYNDVREFEKSLICSSKVLKDHPSHFNALLEQSRSNNMLNKNEQAINDCDIVIMNENSSNKIKCDAYTVKLRCLSYLQRYEEEVRESNKAIMISGANDGRIFSFRAFALYKINKDDEAIKAIKKAIELDCSNADSFNVNGNILRWLGKHEKALESFEVSRLLDPFNPSVYNNIGCYYYYDKKDYEKAIEYYSKAIEIDEKFFNSYIGRSGCYQKLDKLDLALKDLDLSIKHNDKHSTMYLCRAFFYHNRLNNFEKAAEDYTFAIQYSNYEKAEYLYLRSCCYFKLEMIEKCLNDLLVAFQLKFDDKLFDSLSNFFTYHVTPLFKKHYYCTYNREHQQEFVEKLCNEEVDLCGSGFIFLKSGGEKEIKLHKVFACRSNLFKNKIIKNNGNDKIVIKIDEEDEEYWFKIKEFLYGYNNIDVFEIYTLKRLYFLSKEYLIKDLEEYTISLVDNFKIDKEFVMFFDELGDSDSLMRNKCAWYYFKTVRRNIDGGYFDLIKNEFDKKTRKRIIETLTSIIEENEKDDIFKIYENTSSLPETKQQLLERLFNGYVSSLRKSENDYIKNMLFIMEIHTNKNNEPLKVNKELLIIRSEYFRALLLGGFIESNSESIIKIDIEKAYLEVIIQSLLMNELILDKTIFPRNKMKFKDYEKLLNEMDKYNFIELKNMLTFRFINTKIMNIQRKNVGKLMTMFHEDE